MTKPIGYGAGNKISTADDASSLSASTLPSGIDAAKIAGGTVSNAVFAYIANLSSDAQAQINLKLATNGDAGSLTNIPAAQLSGNVARARISSALAAGGDPVAGTVLTASTRVESPTAGPNSTQQHTLPAVASDTVALLAATQTLTNKTISGASNTLTNLPAANLTGDVARARITTALAAGGDPVVGTVVTGSTRVETPSIGPGVGAQHDIPGGTTRILTADSTETVTAKTMSGASNTFTNIPASTALTGQVPVANGGTGASSLTTNGVLYGGSTVGAAGAGTTGQVLTSNGSGSPPSMQNTITATSSLATLSSSPYNLTTTNFENIGLSVTLPSAGTYLVVAHARGDLQVSAAAPAEMTHKLVNITDTADITNSEAYGPLATATGVLFTSNTPLSAIITVAASKSIGVYSKVNAGPTYTTRRVVSDTSGRSTIYYVKLSP